MTRRRSNWRWIRVAAGMALLALAAAACSSPEGPTPQPGPSLTCPSDIAAVSNDGAPVVITYTTPVATGGSTPVNTACAPPSGSRFEPGSRSVTCTATDAQARTAQCSFAVKVSVPPRLTLTKFMAFGDSLTEGKPSRIWALDDFAGSYPSVLYPLMTARYVAQTITLSRQGKGGEATAAGVTRLNGLLASERPEVVLLMEGSNDLSGGDASAIPPAVRNIEQMVVNAKAARAYVFLATIPPQVKGTASGGGYQIVPTYNGEIVKVAQRQNVDLVDVFSALDTDKPAYFGADGLHCTTAGYQKMADTFFTAITRSKLEVAAVTPTAHGFPPLGTRIDESPVSPDTAPKPAATPAASPRTPRRRGR